MSKTPAFWTLGWRALWRDWRAGELHVLILAVALAVASLTAVGFFADRLQQGLQKDAKQLLGGDVLVRSDQPLPPVWIQTAQSMGLQTATTLSFPTMARLADDKGGDVRLISLKAVLAGYPLRGQLQTQSAGQTLPAKVTDTPRPGTVWVDPALLQVLDVQLGDTLGLGDRWFTVERLLTFEPDRGNGFMSFSPRVMMNETDLSTTGLVQPASRVNYRLAVAGPEVAVSRFATWAKQALDEPANRGVRLENLADEGRPEVAQTLGRAEQFLNLVALLAALLSAVAVAIASRAYAAKHLDDCAMLRVLGLSQATMARAYAWAFVWVGLAGALLGVALGWAVHHVFAWLLAGLLKAELPAPTVWPALQGMGVGVLLMLAFGVPPVVQLARVPALRVLRREVGAPKSAVWGLWALGVLGFAGMLLLISRNLTLGAITVAGVALALALFAGVAYAVVKSLRHTVGVASPTWWRLATRQLSAKPGFAVVQVSGLAVGMLALVLLVLLRTDLINAWRGATPPDAPNRFVINIQPEQATDFQAHLRHQGVSAFDWYPMFRGRLVAINQQAVKLDEVSARARNLLNRDFNVSYHPQVPDGNQVVAGRWTAEDPHGLSMEEGVMQTLSLKLGDILTFEVAGMPITRTITSVRKVDWASMRVNFFAVLPQAEVPDMPVTYITAFKAPATSGFDKTLLKAFPNITNVDVSATLAQVQAILDQVITAIEALFAFTLAAGLVVLLAAVGATRAEREHAFAIYRALGASSRLLGRLQAAELLGVGALAGVLASVVALAVGWALAFYVFDFVWAVPLWTVLAGGLAGAVLAWAAGWWGLRAVLHTPVVHTLRKATPT